MWIFMWIMRGRAYYGAKIKHVLDALFWTNKDYVNSYVDYVWKRIYYAIMQLKLSMR